MSGKAYTMKEMKGIVDYLIEHRAYGEIKGRKMWIGFADSNLTTRTWQSLKETFLKRILPDITNPYYKLTVQQITSFRQGYDLEARLNKKLEIRTTDEDSNSNDAQNKGPETSDTKTDIAVHEPGEDPNPTEINRNRSSTDTVVIEPCYNTAEEIQKELESPGQEGNYEPLSPKVSQTKSIRDYITYSEPLTPILQEVLHDFETDDEEDGSDKEPQMQIVEYPEPNIPNNNLTVIESNDGDGDNGKKENQNSNINKDTCIANNDGKDDNKKKDDDTCIENDDSKDVNKKNENQKSNINKDTCIENNDDKNKKEESQNINIINDTCHNQKNTIEDIIIVQDNTEPECIEIPDDTPPNNSENNINDIITKTVDNLSNKNTNAEQNSDAQLRKDFVQQQQHSQNQSIPATDTLPNNQEAFKELCDVWKKVSNEEHSEISSIQKYLNDSKKRAKSQEIQCGVLKKRLCYGKDHQQSSSDVDGKAQTIKKTKTNLLKKKNDPNEEGKKSKDENVISNEETHQSLPKNIEKMPLNTDITYLSDDSVTNKQTTLTEANTSKIKEKEKTSTPNANEKPTRIKKEDLSRISKNTREAESENDMPQDRNPDIQDDTTSLSNERQNPSKLDKHGKSRKSKYKHDSKKGKVYPDNYIKDVINEVVILNSHSDSASDGVVTMSEKNKAALRMKRNTHRDKALANVFGFSSGLRTSRKKSMKHRKRQSSYRRDNSSDSDEWTSESETEYVSPPRGRKNRLTKKYLKPKAARIQSLEEEGGLFVVYGKKIFPLVKDGKIVKNYTTYSPGKDSEDDESFWKLKYVEEKKKTEALTKLLKKNKKSQRLSTESEVSVAITREKSPTPVTSNENGTVTKNEIGQRQSICKETEKISQDIGETKTVKIKYTKNNEEVQLEGHWSHVHPVLEHLVHILHKDEDQTKEKSIEIQTPIIENEKMSTEEKVKLTVEKVKPATEQVKPTTEQVKSTTEKVKPTTEQVKPTAEKPRTMEDDASENQQQIANAEKLPNENQKSSRISTPVSITSLDDDVQDKINKIEDEIFREIEEREKADSILENSTFTNVTQRKGLRTRKSSNIVDQASPAKKSKVSNDSNKAPVNNETLQPQEENKNVTAPETRKTRTPKKVLNDKEVKEKKNETFEKRVTRRSLQDAQSKYNFRASPATKKPTEVITKKKPRRRYTDQPARTLSSPDTVSNNSAESSLGYQDSDVSNISTCLRKKRKLSLTVLNKGKAISKRGSKRIFQSSTSEFSSDSNLSFVTAPVKHPSQSSSSNTEVYRSESYQTLFPKKQFSYKHLDSIEESSPPLNITYCINTNLRMQKSQASDLTVLSPFANDGDSSSQVTLPPSPVLSIVENISVNKNVLSSSHDMPVDVTIGETNRTVLNDNMCLDVDMSVPLMEQNCGLTKSNQNENECCFNIEVPDTTQKISESLLSKVNAVNIKEPTLSESIHQKLKNLLLESAKKIANHINKSENNEFVTKMEVCEPEAQRKTKGRKRCSTPRKRQKRQNLKVNKAEQLIEECTESCRSKTHLPTPLLVVTDASDDKQEAVNSELDAENVDGTKTRKKKDVIKVKITKPKMKKKGKVLDDKKEKEKEAKSSLQTDSGINDTESGVYLQGEDTVDLIHNHSDTCLHAHECVGNSVEMIDENAMSIITLNSASPPVKESKTSKSLTYINDNGLLDILCENAQDAVNFFTAIKPEVTTNAADTNLNISDANMSSLNSLLTDDLSDEIPTPPEKRMSKWYLLSEDETSNTNLINIASRISNGNSGYGSNLQQIFPITCAVPDLSTITEERTPKINTVDTQSLSDVNM